MDVPSASWLDGRIAVARSRIHGRGLFASEPVGVGEIVMRLGGTLIRDAEVRDQIARGERYDGLVLEEDLNLSIRPSRWPGIFGNHGCDPNIWLASSLELAARRDIDAGEEVVSDYATYTMTPEWSMECFCMAADCRRTVTGNDWRRPELQRRYAGHFVVPIARRIAREGQTSGDRRAASDRLDL